MSIAFTKLIATIPSLTIYLSTKCYETS